ncbi:translocation/assembly module TamB domain-containing protein [Methylopila sp. M107]|uniref:translocation/assembly module TamB domain-containing protein n=1 Tax=Methylopila sp. M107 TaxID=1101190 RepID=UPI00036C0402|nr:translocation/assembly module TamB domain-containing protein [Methylopila sp. M107]
MAILKRALIVLGILLLIPIVVLAAVFAYLTTAHGLSTIASLTSTYASSDDTKISVGDIEGTFPYDLTLKDVKLSDRKGEWLTVDRARIVWSPLQLYSGKLTIDLVDIGRVEVARQPDYPEANEPPPAPDPNAPLFPELPIEIKLEKFMLADLGLAEPVIGTPARLAASASAQIRQPRDGVAAEFDIRRTDGTKGQFNGKARFVPATQGVEISLRGSEPEGGLVARMANIPNLPPIDIGMDGAGTLDALRTQLVVTAGTQGRIDGMGEIKREGKARRVTFGLDGDVAGLVQPEFADLVDGKSKVSAEALVPDRGPIQIVKADVDIPAARLGARGTVDTDAETLDVSYDVVAGNASRFAKLLPDITWSSISARGTAKGPIGYPEVRADADAGGLVTAQGSFDTAKIQLTATPDGPLSKDTTKITALVTGEADGVKFADDRLFAGGRRFTLDLDATSSLKGEADIRRAEVSLADVKARFSGLASREAVKGRAVVNAADLSTLAPAVGLPLAGALDLATDLDVAFDMSRLNVTADGAGRRLVTGIPQVDGLTGGDLSIKGGVTRSDDGSFTFQDFDARGEHIVVTANGVVSQARADAKILAEIDDLSKVDARAEGSAKVTADLTGKLDNLGLKALVSVPQGKALDKSLENIEVKIDATDVSGAVAGTLALAGRLDGKPVTGGGRLKTEASGLRRIEGLDLAIAQTTVKGDVAVTPQGLADGKLAFASPDLAEIGALALTELAGKVSGDLALSSQGGVQRATVKLQGADIAAPGAKVGSLDADITAVDPAGKLTLDGKVNGRAIAAGGQVIDTLALVASGAPDGMDVSLDLSGNEIAKGLGPKAATGSSAKAQARVAYKPDGAQIDLSRLDLAAAGKAAELNGPARLRLVGKELVVDSFALRTIEGGVLDVRGRAGDQLDLTLALRDLPLALGNAFTPELGLSGTAGGDARLTGAATQPKVDFGFTVADLSVAKLRDAKVPPLAIATKGLLEGDRVTTDTSVTGAGGLNVSAKGSAPLGDGELDMTVLVRSLPLSIANAFQPQLGFGGRMEADARVTGPVSAPNGTYRAKVVDFTSTNAKGVAPIAVDAKGELQGKRVTTDTTISGGGGLGLAAKGSVPLGPGYGDVDLGVAIRELPLALANAFAPDLALAGLARGDVRISGPIDAPRGNYNLKVTGLKGEPLKGLPALAIDTRGALQGKSVTTQTSVTGGGIDIAANGVAPLGDGDLDMTVAIRELPLKIADAFLPDAGLGGGLRGTARVTGPIKGPSGTYDLTVSDLTSARARGVPALNVVARGELLPTSVTTDALVTGGGGIEASAKGSAPLGEGDLDMTVGLKSFPLALANAFAPELGLDGTAQGTAKVTGPVKAPRGAYDLTVSGLKSAKAKDAPALQVLTRGELQGTRVTTDTSVTGAGGLNVFAKGSAPLGDGDLDLGVTIRELPLALANAVKPELGLGGVMRGDVKLSGPAKRPVGSYDLKITDVVAAQAKAVPPLQVAAKGDLQGDRVTTDSTITGQGGISVSAIGSAPIGPGDLDMKVAIRELPLALANGFKPELGLAGVLRGDAKVTGPVSAPQGTYDLTIADLTAAAAKGVPALQVTTKGALEGTRVTTDTNVSGGGGIQLSAKGSAPIGEGDLDMAVMIRELPLALANAFKPDLGLAGTLRGDAKVAGPLTAPRGTYDLNVTGLTAAQAKGVPALEIVTKGALEGDRVTTDTEVSGGGGVNLTAKGSAPLGKGDVDMAVAIREVPLAIANAFAPTLGLGGKLRGDVKVAGRVSAPQGTYDLTVENLTAAQAKGVPALQIVSKGTLEGTRVTTDTAVTGGGGVRLTAKGTAPIGQGDLDMAVDIAEVPLAIANSFSPGVGLSGKLAGNAKVTGPIAAPAGNYDLRVSGLTAAAAKGVPPLQIVSKGNLGSGRVTTDTAVTGGGGMRITANGSAPLSVTGPLDVTVQIRSVPLSLANGFSPGLGANGTLQGDAKVGGTVSAPAGTYNLKVVGLSTQATRSAGVPVAGIDSKGRIEGKRVFTDTVVSAAQGLRVTANGSAPMGAGDLDLKVAGRAPLGFLNDTLSVSGDRVDGAVTFDVKVGGPTSGPRINGSGALVNASYFNRAANLQLKNMAASVAANGTNIDVSSFRATTRNGGTLSGSGRVAVDPARGFPGQINFKANNAEVIGTDIVTAITDADLRLEGPLARRPVVNGTIRTRSVEIQIPDRIPAAYTPLPDVRNVNPPPALRAQLKAKDTGKGKSSGGEADAFLATLNIDVQAENRIFIRGMGMQAEAGGQIKISGTSAKPVPVGAFDLRSGRSYINVLGKRLSFTRGQVGFAGDLDPTLDFLAETPATGLTAQVVITGNASRPKIEFTSNPVVPQDEVLSRLLFNKSSGELSTSQALTIAQAVAQYSGVGGGGAGPLEGLRKGLGVDTLDIAAGEDGPGLGVGKYISDNIYLGVRSGTTPESTGVTVDIDLTKNIKAQGMAGSAGNTSAGVAIEWDY